MNGALPLDLVISVRFAGGVIYIFGSSGCTAVSSPFEEVGPAPVFKAAFDGEQGVGSCFRPVASGLLESAADDLLADRLSVRARPSRDRADRKAFPFQFLQHDNLLQFNHPTRASFGRKIGWDSGLLSFRGRAPGTNSQPLSGEFYFSTFGEFSLSSNSDGFGPVTVRLQSGDDLGDPPDVQLRLDPVRPQLLFALVRRQRLHGGRRVCQGMEQVEDEDHCPSDENRLADDLDPRRSVGHHRHHLGLEQAVPESELPQAVPKLLEFLDLVGRTLTADAMHTQRAVSAQTVEKGGNCVLPVKGNQKLLCEDVRD